MFLRPQVKGTTSTQQEHMSIYHLNCKDIDAKHMQIQNL